MNPTDIDKPSNEIEPSSSGMKERENGYWAISADLVVIAKEINPEKAYSAALKRGVIDPWIVSSQFVID